MRRQRVILVEDDPLQQRLASAALHDLQLDLVLCNGVRDATAALALAPADLLLTDLTLQGESGLDLLERMARDRVGHADMRIVVYSADVAPHIRRSLAELGVWRILHKPVPTPELRRCVLDALRHEETCPPANLGTVPGNGRALAVDNVVQRAVMQQFGGQLELYQAFWDACVAQFPNDVLAADTACERADAPSLHRLAHSLKTVFGMLGHVDLAAQAAGIEVSIDAGEFEAARLKWPQLRDRIQQLATAG